MNFCPRTWWEAASAKHWFGDTPGCLLPIIVVIGCATMRGVGDAGADRGIETIPRPRKVVGWGSLPGRSKMDQWLSNLSPFETYLLVVPAIMLGSILFLGGIILLLERRTKNDAETLEAIRRDLEKAGVRVQRPRAIAPTRPSLLPIAKSGTSSAIPTPTPHRTETKKSEADQAEGGGFKARAGASRPRAGFGSATDKVTRSHCGRN